MPKWVLRRAVADEGGEEVLPEPQPVHWEDERKPRFLPRQEV